MKRTLNLSISPECLSQDALNALSELEKQGFLVNGKIEYDDSEETVVMGILNRVIKIKEKL